MNREHLFIGGKVFATVALLGAIFAWTLVVFIVLPFAIGIAMHNGKKKSMSGFSLAIAMSPIAVIWTLLMRLWSRDKYNEYEREFLKGFHEGQIEKHYEEGKRNGYSSVATLENLSPIPVYNIRGRKHG